MDFVEGKEAMAIAAIFNESRLQRGFDPGNPSQVNITLELFAVGGLEVEIFDSVSACHDHPRFFRLGGVDKHSLGHLT